MKQMPSAVATVLLFVVCCHAATATAAFPTQTVYALGAAVETLASTTRPRHWPMKRACLYYALAGQALLAKHGIPAMLRVGQVEYRPGTVAAYPIAPHAWLETRAHVIDYAMLPRWGRIAVIPRDLVATDPLNVLPGVTLLLAKPFGPNKPLRLYLDHHYRRFHARSIAAQTTRSWNQRLLEADGFPRCTFGGTSDGLP